MGTVTPFGQREEKHKKWMRQQTANMWRRVTSKEADFLRNKLTIVLLRIRLSGWQAKYDVLNLASIWDINACNISLFMPANWLLSWMLPSSAISYFVLCLFIARLSYSLQRVTVPGSKVSVVPGMAQSRKICDMKWVLQCPIKIRSGISLLLRNSIIQFILSTQMTISMKDEIVCVCVRLLLVQYLLQLIKGLSSWRHGQRHSHASPEVFKARLDRAVSSLVWGKVSLSMAARLELDNL